MKLKSFLFLVIAAIMAVPLSAIVITNPNGELVYFHSVDPNQTDFWETKEIGGSVSDTLFNTLSIDIRFINTGTGWYTITHSGGVLDTIAKTDLYSLSFTSRLGSVLDYFVISADSATGLRYSRTFK
jgi:hypothetical protein